MATTQYIGARYVPLFANPIEWDNTREYEPLTIVTNNGSSYTSKQYVPKGIELTNESFWAVTGNYNAQIEQYRKEVTAYDTRITNAQNTADSANNSIKAVSDKFPVTAGNIADAAVTSAKLATKAVATGNIADAAVTSAKLATNAVATGNIADAAVTSAKLATNAVATGNIQDGAITATKLADSAINSIYSGLTIKVFNNEDQNAANDGMSIPANCNLKGFYISELEILVINDLYVTGVDWGPNTNNVKLPNYVQKISGYVILSACGVIVWTNESSFDTWSGLKVGENNYIYPNSLVPSSKNASITGSCVGFLRSNSVGSNVSANVLESFTKHNGVL